ncbi:endolytic transglycosylase MltG [Janthinobacterium lividum]|uniref:Endolytic murein transglycosylase n=1 Tax=Janthinobacterium lividum TaxID=29581 RepID=A0AAJ4MNQ4_9BURK|nr:MULTISPECIES: endolytic transglycosylase MltG [Janthinobacterium]KAB0325194.1 endolytic transglycosylase MltG [Janthinobacterium lividum]KHA77413.1 aminodeoxychorismate lyase [Janthinobacterium lividum]MBR7634593.1 endolytic transglycosylase MltG [Janthinobacterium lividum]MCC7697368.1 endolytic transglycosylase MltG [Janthinobacterium sp. EB271-G4-7A]MCC7713497.1 endolytic transglycosylase MltG [Janthinobacterium lividum]
MAFFKKLVVSSVIAAIGVGGTFVYWAQQPITTDGEAIPFTISPGSGAHAAGQQIADAGVPIVPILFNMLARIEGKTSKIKAGSYELKPGTTPQRLITQLARGEFAQESLTIIEGWTFKQMRLAMANHPGLKHDTAGLSDKELMAKISPEYVHPEGLFFPDTYLFAKGASEMQIFRQAHTAMIGRLSEAWDKRDPALPYKNPYEALIMASIVEKETGQKSERAMIAGVFVNRLKTGMLLQTDPTVIYGMGDNYQGKIRKRDLEADTPYNTYTRGGLPPTPIALAGAQSLTAALAPARTQALYFVARGDGTSQFSANLPDHNRAVNQYQR